MAYPAEQPVDQAAELDVAQAIEARGGDPVDAVRALILANAMLEQELADLYAKASHGFVRGRRVKKCEVWESEGRKYVFRARQVQGFGLASAPMMATCAGRAATLRCYTVLHRPFPAARETPCIERKPRRREAMAERVGFEPTVRFPAHTLSKRAP